jgi:hypothetical protein
MWNSSRIFGMPHLLQDFTVFLLCDIISIRSLNYYPYTGNFHHYPIKPDEMAARYDPINPPAVGHPEAVQLGGFAPAGPGDRPLPAGPIGEGR